MQSGVLKAMNLCAGVTQISLRRSAKIALIASASLLLFGVSGCRSSTAKPITLIVMDQEWPRPDDFSGEDEESQQFTRETGIRLRHPPQPETTSGSLHLLQKLLREGDPAPDVLTIDVFWPGILGDYLVDLKPYFAAELSSMDPESVASYSVNGKVVAIPYHANVGVLAYRTDLMRQYGYSRPPKTWGELEEMAARIQVGERAKGRKDFWGYVWQGAAAEGLTCNALEWQVSEGGGRIIEHDKTISVNNPDAIRAWQRARRWIGWISPPSVVEYHELDSMNVWDSGRAAFWRTWQWHYRLTHAEESKMRKKIGYTSMPGGPSGRVGTLGGSGLAISRSSTHFQESIELIRFRIQGELQSGKDGADSQVPDPPELYDLPLILDPYGHSGTTNQQRSAVVARPSMIVGNAYEGVSTAYFEAVHSVLTGERSAPQAAAALERRLVEMTGFKIGPPSKGSQSLQ